MLLNIPKSISPELLKVLSEMGHGDTIVIADANYPSESNNARVIRYDGVSASRLLEDILKIFPLDTPESKPVKLMEVSESDQPLTPPIWTKFEEIITKAGYKYEPELIERFNFYESGNKAYAVIASGEEEIYANIIVQKGVIK